MRMALGWIREHRARVILASIAAVLGCLLIAKAARADLGISVDYILWQVVLLIQWIIRLVGDIVLFLVSLLVSAAKYNNFIRAYPVETGWVLVRDVVNMFFIVVLLVIAFSTIVGYEKLHYKGVLPKLLLMAVLINFSKTLIGVLIDFSQVIMLTFVNGFQAAAGGNFMNALKVTKVTQLNRPYIEEALKQGNHVQDLGSVLGASILGLAMLVISASVLAVMVIYILVRIIGLWLLLIMSPIAFFALALPATMQKSLSAFTNDYWSKLSALLTGGPIIAFFLWLALATAQGHPEEFNLYQSQSATEQASITDTAVGISAAGDPKDLASFIVAVVMLLTGLSTAVSITNAVSPQALGAARAVGGLALGATRFAAKTTARTAVSAGVGAAAGAGRLVERRLGVTERLGRAGLAAGRVPIIGGALQRAGARLTGISAARRAEFAAGIEKETKHLTPSERARYKENALARQGGVVGAVFGSAEERQVLEKEVLKEGLSRPGITRKQERLEAEYYKTNGIGDPSRATGAQKKAAKNYADTKSRGEIASEYDAMKKIMTKSGDTEGLSKLGEDLKKDPSLNNDYSKIYQNISDEDYRQALREMKPDALKDSATSAAVAKSFGFLNADGTVKGKAQIEASEQWKELAKSPQRAKTMEAQLEHFRGAGAGTLATQLAALSGAEGSAAAAMSSRYQLVSTPDGGYQTILSRAAGGAEPLMAAPRAMGSFAELTVSLEQPARTALQTSLQGAGMNVNEISRRFEQPITPAAAESLSRIAPILTAVPGGGYTPAQTLDMAHAQAVGVPAPVAFNYDQNTRRYTAPAHRVAHETTYELATAGLESENANDARAAVGVIANTDPSVFADGGEMGDVVTSKLQGHLQNLSNQLRVASDEERRKIQTLVSQAHAAAEHARAKPPAQPLTAHEQRLLSLNEEIMGDRRLKRMIGKPNEE